MEQDWCVSAAHSEQAADATRGPPTLRPGAAVPRHRRAAAQYRLGRPHREHEDTVARK